MRILTDEDIEAIAQRVVALLDARAGAHVDADAIYTPNEAARLIAMHPVTVRRKLREGSIRGSRRSGDWRVRGAELLKLA